MFPPRYNPLNDPDNWNRALRRTFQIEKNQGSNSSEISAITPSFKSSAHQYSPDMGSSIPRLDELVVQSESYFLELEELVFQWDQRHESQYKRKGFVSGPGIQPYEEQPFDQKYFRKEYDEQNPFKPKRNRYKQDEMPPPFQLDPNKQTIPEFQISAKLEKKRPHKDDFYRKNPLPKRTQRNQKEASEEDVLFNPFEGGDEISDKVGRYYREIVDDIYQPTHYDLADALAIAKNEEYEARFDQAKHDFNLKVMDEMNQYDEDTPQILLAQNQMAKSRYENEALTEWGHRNHRQEEAHALAEVARIEEELREHNRKADRSGRDADEAHNAKELQKRRDDISTLPARNKARVSEEEERYEVEQGFDPFDYESRNKTSNVHFLKLVELQPRILKGIAKVIPIINSLKNVYKSKVSGLNLNRIEPIDMTKIRAVLVPFFQKAMQLANKMDSMKKIILDMANKGTSAPAKQKDGIPFRQDFDIAQEKFTKQIKEFDTLYKSDQERYSYNFGKV